MGLGAAESINMTDKSEFVNTIMPQLPEDVQQALANGDLQLVPYHYYGVKMIADGTSTKNHVKVFERGDQSDKGVTNLVQARIPAGDHFMVSKLRVRTAKLGTKEANAGKSLVDLAETAEWGDPLPNVANGEFLFGCGATTYMDKTASAIFDHKGMTTIESGAAKVPGKYLKPQEELNVELDILGNISEVALVRVDVIGVKTQKA